MRIDALLLAEFKGSSNKVDLPDETPSAASGGRVAEGAEDGLEPSRILARTDLSDPSPLRVLAGGRGA